MSESFLSRWARLKRGEPAERTGPHETGDAGVGAAGAGSSAPPAESTARYLNEEPRGGAGASPTGATTPAASSASVSSVSADDARTADPGEHSSETAPVAGSRRAEPVEPTREADLELPPLETLTPQSDFRPFLRAGVAPQMRNAALKKLFADPHFNVMDGLDVYIEDYNLTTPIAESTMRRLVQARTLRLFDDVEQAEPGPGGSEPALLAASPAEAEPLQEVANPQDPGIPAVTKGVPADPDGVPAGPNGVTSGPSGVPADLHGASRVGTDESESGPDEVGDDDGPLRPSGPS